MEEIKKQIEQIIFIHRDKLKDENKVIRKILDIFEKEMIENLKEDIYTTEKSDFGVKHYKNRKLHRIGGEPAVIYNNGDKHWYEDGLHHRISGPASDYYGGWKLYFIHGKYIKTDKS